MEFDVNQAVKALPDLARRLDRFTMSTRQRLARSLVDALRGRRNNPRRTLDAAVGDGCRELRDAGLEDESIKAFFGALVEETGRACGADRPSLLSGELRWMPVRTRVLELVTAALSASPTEPLLAMDHVNGPR
jgi:hypothetical protein